MREREPTFSRVVADALQAAVLASLVPAVAFLILGERIGLSSWGDVARTALPVSVVVMALVALVQGWLWFRGHLVAATAHARAHRAADELNEGPSGRVYPAEPSSTERAGLLDDLNVGREHDEPPHPLLRWWFSLEGWEQASIAGGLAGVLVALLVRRFADNDGFQPADLFGMAWVWSIALWFALTIWAGGYVLRAHPGLLRLSSRDGRNRPAGLLGALAALELFPRSVWFLVTSAVSLIAWPFLAVLRR